MRRYELLAQPGLYLAAVIVLVCAAPMVFISFRMDAAIGDFAWLSGSDVLGRTKYYSSYLWTQLAAPLISLATVGTIASALRNSDRTLTMQSVLKVALASLVVSALAFHIFNPHTAIAVRYIALAVAPLLCLAPVGAEVIARPIRERALRRGAQSILLVTAVVVCFVATPAGSKRAPIGAKQTVDFLERQDRLSGLIVFVVSDERGEGAMVSEVAIRHPMPAATVVLNEADCDRRLVGQSLRLPVLDLGRTPASSRGSTR